MNIVDSSGWLEYFSGENNAAFFAPVIQEISSLIVPSISVYEVFKRLLIQLGKDRALELIVAMLQAKVVDLDAEIALEAARLSTIHKLPMADSIILATARRTNATLWTQDADFKDIDGIQYIEKIITES